MPSWIIDLTIILALALYAFNGYRRGFILLLAELLGTVLVFYVAYHAAIPFATLLQHWLHFDDNLRRAVGFLGLTILLQIIYAAAINALYRLIPEPISNAFINKALGIIPSFINGLLLSAVILSILVIMPSNPNLQAAIMQSAIGRPLVDQTQQIMQHFTESHAQDLTDTFTFLTNTPFTKKVENESENVDLRFKTTQVATDPTSELKMLELVNQERAKVGAKPLVMDPTLRNLARAHSIDMLARGYFSHTNPDHKDPFDRMADAHITYETAGENLAFAPTVEIAHIGLMNSPKHKENILDPEFGHVGIGVINAGIYGRMFTQEFTD